MKKLFFIASFLVLAAASLFCSQVMATKASEAETFDLQALLTENNITVLNHGAYWEEGGILPAELYCETEDGYHFRIISYGDSTPVFMWDYDGTDEGHYEIDFTDAGDKNSSIIYTGYNNITLGEHSKKALIQIVNMLPELHKGICPFGQTGILHFAIHNGDFIGHDQSDSPTYDYDLIFE